MKLSLRLWLILGPLVGLLAGVAIDRLLPQPAQTSVPAQMATSDGGAHAHAHAEPAYVCPMHAEIVTDEPGNCPICGMQLVPVELEAIETAAVEPYPEVRISPAVMNNLGVRTTRVVRKNIVRRVETPGFIQNIRKGKASRYRAPFDGRVKAILFEKDKWHEAGEPLMELESQTLLQAEQRHLELLAMTGQDPGVEPPDAAVDSQVQDREGDSGMVAIDAQEAGGDASGVPALTERQRQQLASMGLDEAAIREMEQEMMAQLGAQVANAESGTVSPPLIRAAGAAIDGLDTPQAEGVDASQPEQGGAEVHTVAESRRYLQRLGLDAERIARLEQTRQPSATLVLRARHPGKVMKLAVAEGDAIEKGKELFRLGGEVRATVLANAFQRDAAWITTGQKVEIRMPHATGEVWPGIVNQGAVSIDPASQNIGVRLAFTAPLDKVRANQYVVGTIYGEARRDVLAVPSEAVIRTENEDRVIVVRGDGRFQPVVVETGVEAGGEVEIREGLEEGDEVVVSAQFLIDSESSLQASLRRLGAE